MADQKRGIKEGFLGQRLFVLPPEIQQTIMQNPIINNFYLTAMGHYPRAEYHEIEREQGCAEYIFFYCTEGLGYITLNDTEYQLEPNTYFIIPKNTRHRYWSSLPNPWSIYWVHFTGNLASQVYERSLLDNTPQVQPIPFEESRINQFEQIYAILESSHQEKELEIANLNLLDFITSVIYYKAANPALYDLDAVSNSIKYMKANLHLPLEIEALARQQKISVPHYCRIFKKKTGSSPINYFNHLKIQKSCQYLYFTEKSIKEICAELSIDDPFYFSRLFRKVIGMPPSRYKKLHKKIK
ncbi:AraC family transcriptional regulator [Adhaeribacter swui]|uniref:AraC family transcriptional regulator n=1 Tax=Adhaeribacter swui TaxID=2086471 RepID=A0A7G7G9D7_9BACT|nr:AraC family transcriptional regulator [Adhaeribacter swui]QNF33771.1 AraC family transcriptional regulator [Adhaeribacter swui]